MVGSTSGAEQTHHPLPMPTQAPEGMAFPPGGGILLGVIDLGAHPAERAGRGQGYARPIPAIAFGLPLS